MRRGSRTRFCASATRVTPPLVAALMAAVTWRGAFIIIGVVSLAWAIVWGLYSRDDPHRHPDVTPEERAELPQPRASGAPAVKLPWWRLCRRMLPVTFVYFCYAWTLWTYLSWVPQYMLHAFGLHLKDSAWLASAIFAAGVVGDGLGGTVSDFILKRTRSLRRARRDQVVFGMALSLLSSIPLLVVRDAGTATVLLSCAFSSLPNLPLRQCGRYRSISHQGLQARQAG